MQKKDVKFSVLMSVYNKTPFNYLDDSIRSIHEQTYNNYEIVLVVDGIVSKEHESIIEYWKTIFKSRLNIVRLSKSLGLAKALNVGINSCKNEWIARMDADDMMKKNRLFVQQEFIKKHDDIQVFGSWISEFDEELLNKISDRKVPITHNKIYKFGKWRCPMNHMSVCYKKKSVLSVGGYNDNLKRSQDYALWANLIINGYKFANIPNSLVNVRTGESFYQKRNNLKAIKFDVLQRIFMYKIKYLNLFEMIISLFFRISIRILPLSIVKKIYILLRENNNIINEK